MATINFPSEAQLSSTMLDFKHYKHFGIDSDDDHVEFDEYDELQFSLPRKALKNHASDWQRMPSPTKQLKKLSRRIAERRRDRDRRL
jgi:hypothetical protein